MKSQDDSQTWVAYAEEDFATAKSALRAKTPRLLTTCFHSQQCAEKYMKALLLSKSIDFPKTHDLATLDILCNQNGILTGFTPQDLVDLSGHAVHTRYPGEAPTLEDAKESIEIAKAIRKFARARLGLR